MSCTTLIFSINNTDKIIIILTCLFLSAVQGIMYIAVKINTTLGTQLYGREFHYNSVSKMALIMIKNASAFTGKQQLGIQFNSLGLDSTLLGGGDQFCVLPL